MAGWVAGFVLAAPLVALPVLVLPLIPPVTRTPGKGTDWNAAAPCLLLLLLLTWGWLKGRSMSLDSPVASFKVLSNSYHGSFWLTPNS
jgi:hypothetical protein